MNEELENPEHSEHAVQPKSDEPKSAGGPVLSATLSDDDLGRVAGGPVIYSVEISTITDLADEDLRQVAGGGLTNPLASVQ